MDLVDITKRLNDLDYVTTSRTDSLFESEIKPLQNLTPNHYLIVYGSLAPGEFNHHELSHIEGVWFKGHINGYVKQIGWGANLGYPGLIWGQNGPKVNASILHSTELYHHWNRLDEFEGMEYHRVIILFMTTKGIPGLGHVLWFATSSIGS